MRWDKTCWINQHLTGCVVIDLEEIVKVPFVMSPRARTSVDFSLTGRRNVPWFDNFGKVS